MKFNAQGKGPLELPRLTSIGPGSKSSETIGEFVFRGQTVEGLNNSEFKNNAIDGVEVNIWIADTASIAKRYGFGPSEIEFDKLSTPAREEIINDLNTTNGDEVLLDSMYEEGLIARQIKQSVTGGLTTKLGAANQFASEPGLVLFIERNRIPNKLTDVDYDKDFINQYPEIAGAADNGSNMIMFPRVNDDYTLGDFDYQYDVRIPEKSIDWGRNPLSGFFRLDTEREVFAHSPQIDLDESLFAVCNYMSELRMKEIFSSSLSSPFKDRFSASAEELTQREMVKRIHEEVESMMDRHKDRLVTCITDGPLEINNSKVGPFDLVMLYDGDDFTLDYDEAVPFTDPGRF